MSDTNNQPGIEGNATDAIMLLVKKHPFICMSFACLALYGLSMFLFVKRDEGTDDRKAWIDEEQSKTRQKIPTKKSKTQMQAQDSSSEEEVAIIKKKVQQKATKRAPPPQKQDSSSSDMYEEGAEESDEVQEKVVQPKPKVVRQKVEAPVEVVQKPAPTQPAPLSQAQKKKEKKKQKKEKEDKKVNEPATNTKMENLGATASTAAPAPTRNDDLPFETVTRQRVVQTKEERKQAQRKDSLDDVSSGSDSDVAPTYYQKKKQTKKDSKKEEEEVVEEKKQEETKEPAQIEPEPVVEETKKEVKKQEKQESLKKRKAQPEPAPQPSKQAKQEAPPKPKPEVEQKVDKKAKQPAKEPPKPAAPVEKSKPAPPVEKSKAKQQKQEIKIEPKKEEPKPQHEEEGDKQSGSYDDESEEEEGNENDYGKSGSGSKYDSEESSDEERVKEQMIKNGQMKYQAKTPAKKEKLLISNQPTTKGPSKLSQQGKQNITEQEDSKMDDHGGFSTKPERVTAPPQLGFQQRGKGKYQKPEPKTEVQILAPKSTIRAQDGMGDWEVVDKRATQTVKKRNYSDSEDGSDLSD